MGITDKRIPWIDMARGLCMMAILFFHTECYYCGEEVIPYVAFAGNAAITFFFISGYVFARPGAAFTARRKLRSILTGLVIPYFIFTALIALPKTLVHDGLSVADAFTDIITGHATWFVPALIVCQLLFMLLLTVCKGREHMLAAGCALPFVAMALLYHTLDGSRLAQANLWCWQNACLMLFFFYVGYALRQREKLTAPLRRNDVLVALLLTVVGMKTVECLSGASLTVEPIHVTSFTLLLIDGLLFALLLCAACQRLPRMALVEYTGEHSLYYYFICGGVPMMVSRALGWCQLPYEGRLWTLAVAFVGVVIVATAIVWLINLVKKKFF